MRALPLALLLTLTTASCVLDWSAVWPGGDGGTADQFQVDRGKTEAAIWEDLLPIDLRPDTTPAPSPWVWIAGGTGSSDILDLAVTPDGGVVAVGLFSDRVSLDKSEYDAPAHPNTDLFVVKVGSDGVHKWHYVAKGAGQNRGQGVAVAPGGDIWVVGDFEKTITFPKTGSPVSFTTRGAEDVFVARLGNSGALKAVVQAGGTGKDIAQRVEVLKDGTAVVTGIIGPGASFTGVSGAIVPKNSGLNRQVFLARFDGQGKALWVETAGGTGYDEVEGLALDKQERIYLAGNSTSKSFVFQGDPSKKLSLTSKSSIFAARVTRDTSGLKVGYLVGGGGSTGVSAQAWGVDVGHLGNAYVAGHHSGGNFSVGGKVLPASTKANMFVVSLDPNGKTRWLQGSTSTGGAAARAVAMDPSGSVLVAGHFTDDFAYPGVSTMTGRGDDDILVLELTSSTGRAGRFLGTGSKEWDRAWAIKPGPAGSVLVGGSFSLSVGFNTLTRTSGGGTDGMIWRAILAGGSGTQ